MIIEELSVGDWVKIGDKVKRVDYLYGKNNVCDMPIEMVEPIPLTAEILEKNGWYDLMKLIDDEDDEDDVASYRTYCDWRLEPNICGTIYGVGGKFHIGDGAEYHKFLELQYVHQLQHALRLAGVEKEIEV